MTQIFCIQDRNLNNLHLLSSLVGFGGAFSRTVLAVLIGHSVKLSAAAYPTRARSQLIRHSTATGKDSVINVLLRLMRTAHSTRNLLFSCFRSWTTDLCLSDSSSCIQRNFAPYKGSTSFSYCFWRHLLAEVCRSYLFSCGWKWVTPTKTTAYAIPSIRPSCIKHLNSGVFQTKNIISGTHDENLHSIKTNLPMPKYITEWCIRSKMFIEPPLRSLASDPDIGGVGNTNNVEPKLTSIFGVDHG